MGGFEVSAKARARVERMAYETGMLAQKLKVRTVYNLGADVIGVGGKLLINGYKMGEVRRKIDLTLRWQTGVSGQFQLLAAFATKTDNLFYGLGKPIGPGTPFVDKPGILGQVMNQDSSRYNTAMQLAFFKTPLERVIFNLPNNLLSWYHSVVHGQKRHLPVFGLLRDDLFYGLTRKPFGTSFVDKKIIKSDMLQKGKTADFDVNDKFAGKPIENGTPHKKGWLSGVSEDEQNCERANTGKPIENGTPLKQMNKQDMARYNTAKPLENGTPLKGQPGTDNQTEGQDNTRYNT